MRIISKKSCLFGVLFFACCQCEQPTVTPTDSVLLSSENSLDFGAVYLGDTKTLSFDVSNGGRSPLDVTFESSDPFSTISAITLNGGATEKIDVVFGPQVPQDFTQVLTIVTLNETKTVTLLANGKQVPICPLESCATWRFRFSTGQCESTSKANSTPCTSACNLPGQCVSGECLSESPNACDDRNSCTQDFCGADGGCFHKEKPVLVTDACKVFRCDADAGIQSENVEDGTSCGESTCAKAKICLNGVCEQRLKPNAETQCQYVDITTSQNATCAKNRNGFIRCWGDGSLIGLPYGATAPRTVPLSYSPTGFTHYSPPCFFTDDAGSVECDGLFQGQFTSYQGCGSLFDGGLFNCQNSKYFDAGFVVAVSTFGTHSCSLAPNGDAWCWGERGSFATDGGTSTQERLPTHEPNLSVRTAGGVSCALGQSGTPRCFGYHAAPAALESKRWSDLQLLRTFTSPNSEINGVIGLLPTGSIERCHRRCEIASLAPRFTKISAGRTHACALSEAGAVYCWGENLFGQLGNMSVKLDPFVIPISGVHASSSFGNALTVAHLFDGRVVAWGSADGDAGTRQLPFPLLSNAEIGFEGRLLSRGQVHELSAQQTTTRIATEFGTDVLRLSKTLPCAINASSGMKCQPNFDIDRTLPISQLRPQDIVSIESDRNQSGGNPVHCALLNDGGTTCFGNLLRQANGTNSLHIEIPASDQIEMSPGIGLCSKSKDGTVWCWYPHSAPFLVTGLLFPTREISVGGTSLCALSGANGVQCLRPGNNNLTQVPMEEPVKHLTSWGANCAVFESGKMKCWGDNQFGQLGVSALRFSDDLIEVTK